MKKLVLAASLMSSISLADDIIRKDDAVCVDKSKLRTGDLAKLEFYKTSPTGTVVGIIVNHTLNGDKIYYIVSFPYKENGYNLHVSLQLYAYEFTKGACDRVK